MSCLLVSQLHAAIALVEVRATSLAIRQDLDLNPCEVRSSEVRLRYIYIQ